MTLRVRTYRLDSRDPRVAGAVSSMPGAAPLPPRRDGAEAAQDRLPDPPQDR